MINYLTSLAMAVGLIILIYLMCKISDKLEAWVKARPKWVENVLALLTAVFLLGTIIFACRTGLAGQ